jgi:hypothetical protein
VAALVRRPPNYPRAGVMPYPERRNEKSLDADKDPFKTLMAKIERVAGDLNPLLMVMVVGLLLLDLTLYLGSAAAHDSLSAARPRPDMSYYPQSEPSPVTFSEGGSVTGAN